MIQNLSKKTNSLSANKNKFVDKLLSLFLTFILFNIIFIPQSLAAGNSTAITGGSVQLADKYVNGFMAQSSLFSPELANILNTITSEITKFNALGYSMANAVTTYGLQLLMMIFAVLLVWGSIKSTLVGSGGLADLFKEIIFLSMVTSIFVFSLYNYVYFMQLIESSFPFIGKTLATGITNGSGNPTGALVHYISSVDLGWLSTVVKDISVMYSKVHGVLQLLGFLVFAAVLIYIGMLVFSIFVITNVTYFISQVLFVVIVCIGPFMIPFAIWRKTYYLFEGWLKFIIVAGLYQVIIFLVYTIIVGVMTYTQSCVNSITNGFFLNLNEATNAISILWVAIGLMAFIPAIAGELVTGVPKTIDGYDTAKAGGMIGFGEIKKGAEKVLDKLKGKSNLNEFSDENNTKWTSTENGNTFFNSSSGSGKSERISKTEAISKFKKANSAKRNARLNNIKTQLSKVRDKISKINSENVNSSQEIGNAFQDTSNPLINGTTASEAGSEAATSGALAEGAGVAATTAEGVGVAAEGAGIAAGAEAGAEAAIVGAQFIPGVDVAVDAAIITGVVAYEGYELYDEMEDDSGNDDNYESYANSFSDHNERLNAAQDHAERELEEKRKKGIEDDAKRARDAGTEDDI
jgi:hypothetical protein